VLSLLPNLSLSPTQTIEKSMDNIIKQLPNEIIQEVASYLSVVDKLSFALAHPVIYRALGRDSWGEILNVLRWKRKEVARPVIQASLWGEFLKQFLLLIRRAFPGFWWCDKCLVLHPHDVSGLRTYGREYGAVEVGPGGTFKECRVKLDPAVVMAVMDRHFKGERNGRCKEYLSGYRWLENGTQVQLLDMNMRTEFRTCQLLWEGWWNFCWSGEDLPKPDDIFSRLREAGFRFCRHLIWKQPRVPWIASSTPLESFMRCQLPQHHIRSSQPTCRSCNAPEVFSCRKCSTELAVRVRRIHNRDFESLQVTITVKKNFGAGEYDKDCEFKNHFFKKDGSPERILNPSGENSEPLFYQCDQGHGLNCYHVRSCAHESRDLEAQGKEPTKIDPEGHLQRTLRLRERALGYDDDYYDST
jgi:hypothetical protein